MEMLFHELVVQYAASNPSKTAAVDFRGEMTYEELAEKSAIAANALRGLGISAGQAAAVYVPYVKEVVLGALSALRAGAVFIPFDDAYPVERMDAMLKDSEAGAVLTMRELWNRKPLHFPEEKVIFMDELKASGENPEPLKAATDPSGLVTEDSPAMLLYTSGTTGHPKGVLHSHKMLLHLVDWMNLQEGAEMDGNTRTGVMSGFSFVGSLMFLLGPLAKGGTVCIAPEESRKDEGFLYQFIREANVTHIFLPAALAAIMAEDHDIRGVFVFAAGEKLRNFRPLCPGNTLINSYGSTETSGVLSKRICGSEETITVGKPFTNTKVRIADEEMRETPPGEAGELLISNDFMSHGYYKLPELSAEKWTMSAGEWWYHTGDRARYTRDGDVELLGRTDNMFKLRGFRIETGEVEAQLAKAVARTGRDDVGQIVAAVKTSGGAEWLTVYYEAKQELDQKAVKEEAARFLPEYMVPDILVRVDALPRNANGKVIREELPAPQLSVKDRVMGALDSEVVARVVLTAIDVLGLTELVSPDDRFTDLGGTSLSAMRFTSLLREQGIKITGAKVLQLNVFRKIAEAAEIDYEQLWSPKERQAVREDFASRGEHILKVLPLTTAQDEMLFEQIIHPDRESYKNVVIFTLDIPVPEKNLREALDLLSDENEVLRSAIVFRHVEAVQQVITDRRVPLEVIDMSDADDGEMFELRHRILQAPMDLQQDSLVRVYYLRTRETNMLCFLTHRIAFDTAQRRRFMSRLMSILEERQPDNRSIHGWRELLEIYHPPVDKEEAEGALRTKVRTMKKETPPEICVYSENKGPKLVFVHTANTGSEAYYQLAARIGDQVSFSVIEPFNLYHMEEARYGIKQIAAQYIEILKRHQAEGPYMLGGWCYGGVVAHEMACRMAEAGEDVRLLILLDSHATTSKKLRRLSKGMASQINREYFETSPLFADLRESGMLDAMVINAAHTAEDMENHIPSLYQGDVLYFKPDQIPSGLSEKSRRYWREMMEFEAGNYEHYCCRDRLRVVRTPHEHDLMMDDPSLDIIVPEIMKAIAERSV